jgi:hypothetical protein
MRDLPWARRLSTPWVQLELTSSWAYWVKVPKLKLVLNGRWRRGLLYPVQVLGLEQARLHPAPLVQVVPVARDLGTKLDLQPAVDGRGKKRG